MRTPHLNNFILAAALTVRAMSTLPLAAQIIGLTPEEAAQEYKNTMATLDWEYGATPGLHAFMVALHANPDITGQEEWNKLAAGIEKDAVEQNPILQSHVAYDLEHIIDWNEEATVALARRLPMLNVKYTGNMDLYREPPPGVTEEQLAAVRKFTSERNSWGSPSWDFAALAKQVPPQYVMRLYTSLSLDSGCYDRGRPMSALIAAHRPIIEKYFKDILKWTPARITDELAHPGKYNTSRYVREYSCPMPSLSG